MNMSYEELKKLSDKEVVNRYNNKAKNTVDSLNFYLQELYARNNEKTNNIMIKCTIAITIMTAIMTIATIVNIIIAFKL